MSQTNQVVRAALTLAAWAMLVACGGDTDVDVDPDASDASTDAQGGDATVPDAEDPLLPDGAPLPDVPPDDVGEDSETGGDIDSGQDASDDPEVDATDDTLEDPQLDPGQDPMEDTVDPDADASDTDVVDPPDTICGGRFPLSLPPDSPPMSSCGGEGQAVCVRGTPESHENGMIGGARCDRGLVDQGGVCRGSTRHASVIKHYQTSWQAWAVAFQRDELGLDAPFNHTTQIVTNNSYNSHADGYLVPNQHYSLSDQLDGGVRGLNLDVVYAHGRLMLCDPTGEIAVCTPSERGLTRALEEVRAWLAANPTAIVVLRFGDPEAGWPDGLYGFDDLEDPNLVLEQLLLAYFGDLLVPRSAIEADRPWPTRRTLLEAGHRVIAMRVADNKPDSDFLWYQPTAMFKYGTACMPASRVGVDEFPPELFPGTQPGADWLAVSDSEDRSFAALGTGVLGAGLLHPLDDIRIRWQSDCSVSQIELDLAFAAEYTPPLWCLASPSSCPDPDHRLAQTIWSFAPGDRGQNGPDVVQYGGRWQSAPAAMRPCACARGADPIVGTDWTISADPGDQTTCVARCEAENDTDTPEDARWRFAAPIRATQNYALSAAMRRMGVEEVLLAVARNDDGSWSINQNAAGCADRPPSTFTCTASEDCYTHVPLNLASDACCDGTCTPRVPDYLGIHFCPDECQVSATAPPGSCGDSCYGYFDCGGDGQSACTIDKCFPSCGPGLAEFDGMCTSGTCYERRECGGDGQPACNLWECFPSCDEGLAEFGGQCTSGTCYERHGCGADGQDACDVIQCFPSCDDGLSEYGLDGKCTSASCYEHTDCGGDGQRACNLWECFPSCDGGLAEFAGECAPSCFDRWDYGGEGQDACTIDKCLPSCRDGLTEYGGRCTAGTCHDLFDCGGNGQGACTIDRCFPSCEPNLQEYAGICSTSCQERWNCGGEGQSACTIDRCIPSCRPGMTEYGGRCTAGTCYALHRCGSSGQSPCNVSQCFPSCRSGLGEYAGQCHSSCHDRHGCGSEGQHPCQISQCFPSCKPGLREDFIANRCVR